jgi:hypothetical protein
MTRLRTQNSRKDWENHLAVEERESEEFSRVENPY